MNIQRLQQRLGRINRMFFSTIKEEKIELPLRIHRGPTDILRALESTIQRDPTAAHYKYHDDPFLLPMNNLAKRSYAMAQEAGRKAAHWVRSENPELFNHSECEPPIEAFFPKVIYTEETEVTEEDLLKVIDRNEVSDAILVYTNLKNKGIEISAQTSQNLLEFLCFYNNEDTLNDEFIEERWFRQSSSLKEKQRKTWTDGGLAEEIFNSIENPTGEAYSALIQGMAKYNQASRAFHLFEEAESKGIEVNVNAYNAIIGAANFLKEGYDLRWAFVTNMLDKIRQAGLKPNLGTLNSTLQCLSTMGHSKMVKTFALKTLREFKDLGIEPSLGSWYYVLITFCKDRGPKSAILTNILSQVENQSHKISDIADTHFFVTAMDIANNHLHDLSLGQRVHKLLLTGKNYDLIGDSYKESIYYRHYFNLLLSTVPIDEFMEKTYNNLVPHIYVPEPSIMKEVIKQIELNGAIEYVPKIWSDMIIFNHINREELVTLLLGVMIDNEPPSDSELVESFSNIGWNIYTTVAETNEEKFNVLHFTGEILGKILIVVLRNNDFERGLTVFEKLNREQQKTVGVPSFDALSLFLEHCIKNKSPSKAIDCIQYAADSGFPDVLVLGARLNAALTLDESHLNRLSKFVSLRVQ